MQSRGGNNDNQNLNNRDTPDPFENITPREAAATLGYTRRIDPQRAPFNSHGQAVFTNGRDYITRDVDRHSGGVWKKFDRRGRRLGTYDENLQRIGD